MESIEATQQRLDESVFSMNTERDLYLQQEAIVSSRLHQLPIRERSVIKTTTPNREQTLNDLATERIQLRQIQRTIREKLDAIIDAESGILREYRDLEERIVVQSALASTKRLQLQNAKETKARAVKINALLEEQKETPRLRTPPKPQTNKKQIATQKSPEKQEECSICLIPDIERSPWWIDERVHLLCGHLFHSECLNDWILRKKELNEVPTCPMCRNEMSSQECKQVQYVLLVVQAKRNHALEIRKEEKAKATRKKLRIQKLEKQALLKLEEAKRKQLNKQKEEREREHVSGLAEKAERQAAEMAVKEKKLQDAASERMALYRSSAKKKKKKKKKKKDNKEKDKVQSDIVVDDVVVEKEIEIDSQANVKQRRGKKQKKQRLSKSDQFLKDKQLTQEEKIIMEKYRADIIQLKQGMLWLFVYLGLGIMSAVILFNPGQSAPGYSKNYDRVNIHMKFFDSCKKGDIDYVKTVLDQYKNQIDINKHNQIVQINKPMNNQYEATPLYISSQRGHLEIVKLLLGISEIDVNRPAKNGFTPLYTASKRNHVAVVKLLLGAKDIDVNQPTKNGATPIYIASSTGYIDIFKLLLRAKNIDVNQPTNDGTTPLLIALSNSKNVLELRYMQIVRLLLLEDRLQVNQASHNKLTPLFVCSQNNLVDVVELLLKRKDIEINKAIEDGRTPLYIASQKNNTKIVKLLLAADGINVMQGKIQKGTTPLYIAAKKGYLEVVKMLLAMQDIEVKLETMAIAKNNGHTDVYELLRHHTGKIEHGLI